MTAATESTDSLPERAMTTPGTIAPAAQGQALPRQRDRQRREQVPDHRCADVLRRENDLDHGCERKQERRDERAVGPGEKLLRRVPDSGARHTRSTTSGTSWLAIRN